MLKYLFDICSLFKTCSHSRVSVFKPPPLSCEHSLVILVSIYVKSMLIFSCPSTLCCTLSGVRNPTLSSTSLDASNWTYSDFALPARWTSLLLATTAPRPSVFAHWSIMYLCTFADRSVREACTLPPSFVEYPALTLASLILQPLATSVSTNLTCLAVSPYFACAVFSLSVNSFSCVDTSC